MFSGTWRQPWQIRRCSEEGLNQAEGYGCGRPNIGTRPYVRIAAAAPHLSFSIRRRSKKALLELGFLGETKKAREQAKRGRLEAKRKIS